MKRLLMSYLITSVLFCFTSKSQSDYLNQIAEEACECMDNIPIKANKKTIQAELGSCMISATAPYKIQILNDYGFNIEALSSKEGEQLSLIIGKAITEICPELLTKITLKITGEENSEDTDLNEKPMLKDNSGKVEGVLTKIERSDFVTFVIKDDFGKTQEFIWLTKFETIFDLNKIDQLIGEEIGISYEQLELYDQSIKDYRTFNVIVKMK